MPNKIKKDEPAEQPADKKAIKEAKRKGGHDAEIEKAARKWGARKLK